MGAGSRPTGSGRDAVAARVGKRLRRARIRKGLTQQQVAGERYSRAYVSAVEGGLVRPLIADLDYLAARVGTTASQLLGDGEPVWTRLDADVQLAAGRWHVAAEAYRLLETADERARAEALLGLAEALVRLGQGADAATAASEAARLFGAQGREELAALASYWHAGALYVQGRSSDARAIVLRVLGRVRTGLRVEPHFKLRLLMALATNEGRDGNHRLALSYLEEIRGLAEMLDDRRRATFYYDLASNYCAAGDYEAAIRAGYASLALFEAASAEAEMATTENDLSLAHLGTGNTERAAQLAESARRRCESIGDERLLAHVLDTQAQIAAARTRWTEALELAREALSVAERTRNTKARIGASITTARAHAGLGAADLELDAYERAFDLARQDSQAQQRRVLVAWAAALAARGDHGRAFVLQREALWLRP